MPKTKQKFYGAYASAENPVYQELEGTVEEISGELYGFSRSATNNKWIVTHIPTGMRPFKKGTAGYNGFDTQKAAREQVGKNRKEIEDALASPSMAIARKNLAKYVASVERGTGNGTFTSHRSKADDR